MSGQRSTSATNSTILGSGPCMMMVMSECITLLVRHGGPRHNGPCYRSATEHARGALSNWHGSCTARTGDVLLFGGVCRAMGGFQHGPSRFLSTRAHDDHGSVPAVPSAADGRVRTYQPDGISRHCIGASRWQW